MVAIPPVPLRVPIVDETRRPTLIFREWLELALKRAGGIGDQTIILSASAGASTDNAVARFNGTTGDSIQSGVVIIDDSGNISGVVNITLSGTITGALDTTETTVGQAALASAGTVTVLDSTGAETWKVREIYLSGEGTNFSGGGGDRDLDILEGSTIFTTIPAATLQSLAAARWGDTGVPFPATAAHFTTATSAGGDILAQYSGGTTDYTAGSLKIVIIAERIA